MTRSLHWDWDVMASGLSDWAVQTGISVTILTLFVLIIRRPFAQYLGAKAAYALWLLPAIRLVLPTITLPGVPEWKEVLAPDPSTIFVTPDMLQMAGRMDKPVADPVNWGVILVAIWLGVAALWFLYQMLQYSANKRGLRHHSRAADDAMQSRAASAARQIGLSVKHYELRIASAEIGPLVTGLVRPMIIVPESFQANLTPAQQDFAFVHELAHIKRKDLWAAMGALVFRAVNWPNPLVHFAAHKFRTDQEAACDASVINAVGGGANTTENYAETLLQSARAQSAHPAASAPLGLALTSPTPEGDTQ